MRLSKYGPSRRRLCGRSHFQSRCRTSAVVADKLGGRAARTYTNRTVLELRNLAKWIQHRIGQQIRRGLVITERDEHRAARCAFVGERGQRDAASSRGDGDRVAGIDTELRQVLGVDR